MDFTEKLHNELEKYENMPLSERTVNYITMLLECEKKLHDCEHSMTLDDAKAWVAKMDNTDGTTGEHWSIAETSTLLPEGIDEIDWYATMNMVYSDYHGVAVDHGVDTTEFYADLARAFIEDDDAPKDKVARYYHMVKE